MAAHGRKPGGSSNPRYARGTARAKLRRRLAAEGRGCWICRAFGRPDAIDYSLPARHPRSFEVDDLVPVSRGGDPTAYDNVDAAHRECNNWRSNRSVAEVMALARASRIAKSTESHGAEKKDAAPGASPKGRDKPSRDW